MPDLVDGRYQLLDVLASGGMATVWRARDTRLDRTVAVKRPHPAPADDPVNLRMDREASVAASLNHPNLVTIYDVGRDDRGPFLVMELIEGPTLSEVGVGMDAHRAVEIGAQLASGLAAVHAAGIVHRDVKPANVLMSSHGPQLTDFGIALGDQTGRLTQPGTVVATPAYASPEQLSGRPANPASDVFSLAAIVYELISGRRPFSGTDRSSAPEPLDDAALDELLRSALSPDPAERPAAKELAEALRSAAPTVSSVPDRGSTIPMTTVAAADPTPPAGSRVDSSSPRSVGLMIVAAVAGLALLGFAVAESRTPTEASTTPAESAATASSTTSPPTTSTTALSTTAPPTTVTTIAESDSDALRTARDDLESALSTAHSSDLNPNDVRELMEKADDAIVAVEEGNDGEAGQKLREIAREIDDKLDDEVRQVSIERLLVLANTLGVSIVSNDDDDDD